RVLIVTGVQTCALPILEHRGDRDALRGGRGPGRMSPSGPGSTSGAQPDRGVARGGSAEGRRLLDPAIVARLAHLDVRARLVVEEIGRASCRGTVRRLGP